MKMKKRKIKKFITAVLTTAFILTTIIPNFLVKAENINDVYINERLEDDYNQELYLGGGPSPSAVWTRKGSYNKTFTVSQLRKLNTKLQSAVKAGKKTQPNVIQESANTVSRALSRNKSTTIKVERWIRPATSESMCVYKSIVK